MRTLRATHCYVVCAGMYSAEHPSPALQEGGIIFLIEPSCGPGGVSTDQTGAGRGKGGRGRHTGFVVADTDLVRVRMALMNLRLGLAVV